MAHVQRVIKRVRHNCKCAMSKIFRSMASVSTTTEINVKYEEAIKTLNTLQSNAQVLEKIRQQRNKQAYLNVPNMIKFVERAGMSLDDIDKLSIIHVSGTKGKGSTCAFCESVLRHNGYKTGFFSSPHLVEVRERFRINGIPISKEKFANYFWDVYGRLEKTKESSDGTMPAYFAFLTVMAFHVFIQENIDVAIVEVGIGGQYDSTNLIRRPVVCGVSSLGLDHTSILGETVDKIAWHKAGIFKPSVPAVTSPQPDAALQVLQDRAKEIGNTVSVAPPFSDYESDGDRLSLGLSGKMQSCNASLALQLCKVWIDHRNKQEKTNKDNIKVQNNGKIITPPTMAEGLKNCVWAGRNQTLKKPGLTYYLDGAHTLESIQQCVEWFVNASRKEAEEISGKVLKVIVFNTTGDRDPSTLIDPLVSCNFDAAAFCPNIAFFTANTADTTNFTVSKESQLNRVLVNMHTWERLSVKKRKHKTNKENPDGEGYCETKRQRLVNGNVITNCQNSYINTEPDSSVEEEIITSCQNDYINTKSDCELDIITKDFPCISTALHWASQGREPNTTSQSDVDIPQKLTNVDHIQILVTGSLHLVGGVLGLVGS